MLLLAPATKPARTSPIQQMVQTTFDAMLGIFTDGDLRRTLDKRIDIHSTTIGEVMTKNPTVAQPDMLAVEGLNLMQSKNISALVLCKSGKVVGALNMHDLLKAGVM